MCCRVTPLLQAQQEKMKDEMLGKHFMCSGVLSVRKDSSVIVVHCASCDPLMCTGKLKELGNGILGKFGLSLDNFKAKKDPTTVSTFARSHRLC